MSTHYGVSPGQSELLTTGSTRGRICDCAEDIRILECQTHSHAQEACWWLRSRQRRRGVVAGAACRQRRVSILPACTNHAGAMQQARSTGQRAWMHARADEQACRTAMAAGRPALTQSSREKEKRTATGSGTSGLKASVSGLADTGSSDSSPDWTKRIHVGAELWRMPRMEIGVGEATEKAPHDQPVFL
jgi:hypothetical protein